MKKNLFCFGRAALACLLIFSVFFCSSCTFSLFGNKTVPFSEIEYERPDVDALSAEIDNAIKTVNSDASLRTMLNAISKFNQLYVNFYTMETIIQIGYYSDTTDSFSADEMDFFNEKEPLIRQKMEALYAACASSPRRDELEDRCFEEGFLDDYDEDSTMSDKLVELFQKEQDLTTKYTEYISKKTVNNPATGKFTTLNEGSALDNPLPFYQEYLKMCYDDLAKIYCDLAEVRQQIAVESGYNNYNEYANHEYNHTNTPEVLSAYLKDMNSKIGSLYISYLRDIYYERRDDPTEILYTYYPITSTESEVKTAVGNLSSGFTTVFNFMQKYEMYNIAPSKNKYDMSFTTYLYAYNTPYLLLNPSETYRDILDFSHEFGHFADMYRNGTDNNLDLAETMSQGMSMLTACRLSDRGLSKMMQNAAVLDLMSTMYSQSSLAIFEYDVYSDTSGNLRGNLAEYSGEVLSQSSPGAKSWVLIPHLFTQPCYVQSYCYSADAAMQIYVKECGSYNAGVTCYLDLMQDDRTGTFADILGRCGLTDPLTEGHIDELVKYIREWMNGTTAAEPTTESSSHPATEASGTENDASTAAA